MSASDMASKRCPRIFRLAFSMGCLLFLASCGLKEKGAEKLYDTGTGYLDAGDPKTAEEDFSRAIDLDSDYALAYLQRARARFELKDFTNAESDCSTYIKLGVSSDTPYLFRGLCEYQLKDFTGASNDFSEAISLDPQNEQASLYRGAVRLKERDWDGAVADFTKVIQINPNNAMALEVRGAAYIELKEYEKTLADASDSIRLGGPTAGAAYVVRSHAKSKLKDRTGALADVEQAIELKPTDCAGYIARSIIELTWDDFANASNDLESATEFNPTNRELIVARAILEHKDGDIDAAAVDYNRALAVGPDPYMAPDLYDAMGQIKQDSSQWNQALEEYRKGLAFNSPQEGLHFEAFLMECRLGETQVARNELSEYIKSIPPAKAHDWPASIAHFLAGSLSESEFLSEATTTAKRPTDVSSQICDAYYYEGIVHLLAGDKMGAVERLQKSVDTKEDNSFEYMNALSELKTLKAP